MDRIFLKRCLAALIGTLLYPFVICASTADVPAVIHYQAHLTDSSGTNFDGAIDAEVWIYDVETDGSDRDLLSEHLLYAESHEDVRCDRGTIRLSIGVGRALGRFSGSSLPLESLAKSRDIFIQLYLNGEKISPRQHVGYQNYALKAQYAKTTDNLSGVLNIPASSIPGMDASKTYGAISSGRIPAMNATNISGTISANRVPTLPLDKLSSGTLGSAQIANVSSANITEGKFALATMPDEVMVPAATYFEAGEAADGERITIPPEFRFLAHPFAHCGIMVGIQNLDVRGGAWADELVVYAETIGMFGMWTAYEIHCEAEHDEICTEWITNPFPDPPTCTAYATRTPCTASYLMACINYRN